MYTKHWQILARVSLGPLLAQSAQIVADFVRKLDSRVLVLTQGSSLESCQGSAVCSVPLTANGLVFLAVALDH